MTFMPNSRILALIAVLGALFLSGTASIVNQVVWQRGLKIQLGGSESISSMIVVLVFMLGLGLGAALMGSWARRVDRPLRIFASIELALCLVNLLIAGLFALDLSESIYAVQRLALSTGLPLRLIYALAALLVLLVPTVLMGATLPIASETCQRQLGARESSLITILFFLNTLGAVLGAFGSSFVLLPLFGQRFSLIMAAALNLVAAAILFGLQLSFQSPKPNESTPRAAAAQRGWRPNREEMLGFGLGCVSLAYEMYLFRLMALAHEPLPVTFAITLCFYLLFWSVGVFFSSRFPKRLTVIFSLTALMVATTPYVYELDRFSAHFSMAFGGLLYFIPCIGFGLLYGVLVSRSNRDWGSDVGRYYAYNTLGSCLGILAMTLVGYELPLHYGAFVITVGILVSLFYWLASSQVREPASRIRWRVAMLTSCVALVGLIMSGLSIPYSLSSTHGIRTYWGRDGVVEVFEDGDVYIDGLWHTHLSPGGQHIGKSYTWMMAVSALLARDDEPAQDILVIGNGVGLTASTFAGQPEARIDAYEINRTLEEVLRDYEAETLGAGRNPQIKIAWMDARSGLALNTKQYDIIVSAPLYLRQAGSSTLLSKEYFELLGRRLKPKGVVAVYAHEGTPAQSTLVRRTIASVFEYQQTFDKHVVLIASNDPIRIDREALAKLENRPGVLAAQLRNYGATRAGGRRADLLARLDRPSAPVRLGKFLITDDHPLVEYIWAARRLVDIESENEPSD